MNSDRILALIPAYNESPRISPVIIAARAHLPVLVVDDGSKDGTAETAAAAGAQVLVQDPNQGKGAALKAGIRRALEEGWDAVVTLDADGQHDPSEIPRFVEAFSGGGELRDRPAASGQKPDLILGTRRISQMPPVRRLANALGRISFSWALGRPVRDNQSGYRLLSRRLLEAVLESDEAGFEFEVEVIVIAVLAGMRIAEVPIRTIYTGGPSHIRSGHHLKHFLRMVLRTRERTREFRARG